MANELRKAQDKVEEIAENIKDKVEDIVADVKKSGVFARIWGFIKSVPGKVVALFKKLFS